MSGELTAFLSAICYSLSYVFLRKGQVERETPDNGLFLVLAVSSAVLVFASLIHMAMGPHRAPLPNFHAPATLYFVAGGITSTFLGRLALYAAIDRLGATRGVVIKTLEPLVTLGIALFMLGEKMRGTDKVSILLLLSGLVLLSLEPYLFPKRLIRSVFVQGVLVGLGAAILQGIGHTIRKVGMSAVPLNPLYAAAIDVVAAFLVYTLVLAAIGRLPRFIRQLSTSSWYLYVAGILSATGVLLFFDAVSKIPVFTAAFIAGSQPLFVALLSAALLSSVETLNWAVFIASWLVAAGIIMAGWW